MTYNSSLKILGILSSTLLLGTSNVALGQTADQQPTTVETVTVTATRVEANVQDVSLAITAISGRDLEQKGISDPADLTSLAPNLVVDQGYTSGRTHVTIRGLSDSAFNLEGRSPVSIYMDDVYQPYQFGIGAQIFDMSRIEVLRGPQGTLFGKNTTGGSLNYFSQRPTQETEGYFTLGGTDGDYNRYYGEGAVNLPLSETLATRLSVRVDHRDGYIKNLFNGDDLGEYTTLNGRLQFEWTPTDDWVVNLKIFGVQRRGDGPIYQTEYVANPCDEPPFTFIPDYFLCSGGVPTPTTHDSRSVISNKPSLEDYDNYGATLNVSHTMGGGYVLTSITNLQEGYYEARSDDMGTLADFFHSVQKNTAWQGSQELRLTTPVDRSLRGVFGVFAQIDQIHANQGFGSTTLDPLFFLDYNLLILTKQDTLALAAFASGTYDITDQFSLSAGLRFSHERKSVHLAELSQFAQDLDESDLEYDNAIKHFIPFFDAHAEFQGARQWQRPTWDVTATFKPNDDALLYAKVGTGFRSGQYFTSGFTFTALNPETVTAYEVGFKTDWLDHRLRVNGAAFWMDYSEMQVQTTNTTGPGLIYSNAGAATVKGLELEIVAAPVAGLLLSGSIGYTSATYEEFNTLQFGVDTDLAGKTLPFAPRWTANLGASYEMPLSADYNLLFSTNWNYRGKIFFDPNNIAFDDAHWMGDARISLENGESGWRLTGYVKNILDEESLGVRYFLASGDHILYYANQYGLERVWGVEANYRF